MARDPKKQRRSRAEWLELIEEWQESGLEQEEFCDSHSIKLGTFRWWCWRLKAAAPGRPSTPSRPKPLEVAEIDLVEVSVATPAPAVEAEPGELFEILLPSGVQLRCPVGCSGRSLAEVLWALEVTS